MENVSKPPDSENTDISESHNGQRDLSLTDSSLTESAYSPSLPLENQVLQRLASCGHQEASISGTPPHTHRENEHTEEQSKLFKHPADLQNKSSKEEKQRQNEEIVTLESSSVSSETGSWESVFPVRPAQKEKDACTAFINNERTSCSGEGSAPVVNRKSAVVNLSNDPDAVLVQRSPYKSTSCFIDAASLLDDDDVIQVQSDDVTLVAADVLPAPSQPLACTTAKNDLSPLDWSESYDNDDSLEQLDKKDPDSIKKDMSPTIFDMTPVTEDSLSGNAFEEAAQKDEAKQDEEREREKEESFPVIYEYKRIAPGCTRIMTSTPHNSLGAPKMKTLDVDDCDSDSTVVSGEGSSSHYFDYSSGGTTKDDHVPQPTSKPGSLLSRQKINNIPIVSGAYNPVNVFKTPPTKPKVSNASAWVVDMSSIEDDCKSAVTESRRPGDRMCETLKSEEKLRNHDSGCSRSSVDSDSSERSSHKFYIDLSSLPDHSPPKIDSSKSLNEKKNIFSMYIDLGEQPPVKEMPARLSSSLNAKRNAQSAKTSPRPKAKTNSSLKSCKNDVGVSSSSTPSRSLKKTADPRLLAAEHESPKDFSLFEEYENLCANTEISISEIIGLPEKVNKLGPKQCPPKSDVTIEKEDQIQSKTLSAMSKQAQAKESSKEVFVRLSDLDKKRMYVESSDTIYEHCVSDIRMTRSIPDTNWVDPSHYAMNSRSIEVISSFHSENTLSLNRLFPHLKNEFSRSMPSSLASRTRSPMRLSSSNCEVEEVISDLSELSSVQSSYHRSVVEKSTTEDSQSSSLIGNCQSRLGEDLLRMFLEEIAPDVIVEVSGKRFKAHKCILSSRCQYFAGILSGGWVESAGNVIVLPPFSYNVVHFALCHIYSGASAIPDSVSMVELATLTDMLGLEGLKEAIMVTLKVKYCHNFHKPCQVCTAGVLECFPLSSVYGLDDLYLKCLRWITKHFHKVWPTKAFATLPKELLDKCYQQHIVNMTTETLVDTVCGCGMTEAGLPSTRWAETVARLCRRLLNAAAHHAAPRLSAVVRLAVARPPPPAAVQTVDDCLAAAIEWAPPNEACRAYAFLSQMTKELRNQQNPKPDLVTNGEFSGKGSLLWSLANHWRIRCEESIVRSAPRAIDTQAFKELPADLRKRLRDLGCIIYGSGLTASISPVPDKKRTKAQLRASSRSQDMEQVRANFVPYSPSPPVQGLNRPSQGRLRVNAPKIRTTKAQEERARFNLAQTTHSQERRSKTNRYENTKPRYLEPLNKDKESDAKKLSANRLNVKMISSTESSRNSSPVLSRNVRASRIKGRPSQDSLASRPKTSEPSTEELSESQNSNKYATYTKAKHSIGSAESVKSYNHPKPLPLSLSQRANTIKTKIPIYQNHFRTPDKMPTQRSDDKPPATQGKAAQDRKVSASLMMATKSSSAKVVPKITNDKKTVKQTNKHKGKTKNAIKLDEPNPAAIPLMDRSGTFLKDEPTFGDKTTNIDVAQ